MRNPLQHRSIYGLIGNPLGHSFSKSYFSKKFSDQQINAEYRNFEIQQIDDIKTVLDTPFLKGLNVTIPYKQTVLSTLDKIDAKAAEIGAVNTIFIDEDGSTTGYNTDMTGFKESIQPLLQTNEKNALVLGNGGASRAIRTALLELGIEFSIVSRHKGARTMTYDELGREVLESHSIVINATPLGMFPDIGTYPNIPYNLLSENHLLFDLVYNPEETEFLKRGKERGCRTKNGMEMLQLQAEAAWKIWTEKVDQ